MKFWSIMAFLPILSIANFSHSEARVLSPSSVEVKFSFSAEFRTTSTGEARQLVLDHAKYLFGYMQNPQIGQLFGLDGRIAGIGAPRWEPEIRILSNSHAAGARTVRYEMNGRLLLIKSVASDLLRRQEWQITLPYEIDNFWDDNCHDPAYPGRENFWYFHTPFAPGCERLRESPLARSVTVQLERVPIVNDEPVGLGELRGDNGNGDIFQIAAINGFDSSSLKRNDDGRVNFMKMNSWLRDQGFKMTILSHFKNRPIYLFEKTLVRSDGSTVHARILRLLADTDIGDSKRVTFAKFLKQALEESDVVIYEGHSGLGVNLNLQQIEQQLLLSKDKRIVPRIEFDRKKHQIFLFDSCSSYSYYLGMFAGRKDPGTLAVMSNGLESEFGFEIPMTQILYGQLLDLRNERLANDGLTWSELLKGFEQPLGKNTFMLNVDINDN